MFYLSDKFINQIVAKNLQFLSLWLSFFKMHKTLTNLYSHILALIFITLVKETCKKCKWFSKLTLLLIVSPQNYIEEIFFGLNNIEKIICILNELFIRYTLLRKCLKIFGFFMIYVWICLIILQLDIIWQVFLLLYMVLFIKIKKQKNDILTPCQLCC